MKASIASRLATKGDQDAEAAGLELANNHPQVVFAIKPKLGEITNKWIHPHHPGKKPRFTGDSWKGDWFEPEWYKLPCPVQWADGGNTGLFVKEGSSVDVDPRSSFHLGVVFKHIEFDPDRPYVIDFVVNQDGRIKDRNQHADLLRKARLKDPTLPDPMGFELLDWEFLEPPCGLTTSQSSVPRIPRHWLTKSGQPILDEKNTQKL